MRLYIPGIGEVVTLLEDWKFNLYTENRNERFALAMGLAEQKEEILTGKRVKEEVYRRGNFYFNKITDDDYEEYSWKYKSIVWKNGNDRYGSANEKPTNIVTLPLKTQLKVDRVYIKKGHGMSDYESVTFIIVDHPINKKLNKKRFWVKLKDANTMIIEDK
jgi:hypothetical protein